MYPPKTPPLSEVGRRTLSSRTIFHQWEGRNKPLAVVAQPLPPWCVSRPPSQSERLSAVGCRSAGLHRTNITQFMLTHRRFLAFYTTTPCLRLWFYYPVHCRLQLSHILRCPCPSHCKCHPLEVTDCNSTYPKKLKRGGDRHRQNPERRLSTKREWWNTNPEGFHSSWQGRRRTKLEVGGHGRSQGEHLGLAPTSVQSLPPETLCPVSSCQGRFHFVPELVLTLHALCHCSTPSGWSSHPKKSSRSNSPSSTHCHRLSTGRKSP